MTNSIKIISKKEYKKVLEQSSKKLELPNQEIVWNDIAEPWKNYVVKKIPIIENFLNKVSLKSKDFKKSKNAEKCKIADIGCGTGRNMISSDKIEYYGVDFSEGQLVNAKRICKEAGVNVNFFHSKASRLPKEFKDEMFDYGLFIATLHCIEGEKERLNALKEFYRILKLNAEALISVWKSDDKRFDSVENHGDVYMSWMYKGDSHMRYYYLYSKKELLDLLKKVGFKIMEIYKPTLHDRFSKKNWIVRVKKI